MNYYIVDTTLQTKDNIKQFPSYPDIVRYLEEVVKRKYNQTRSQRMILLEEVGHGSDDNQAVNFVRSMSEEFSMGIVRENRFVRCDIIGVALYQKEEYGS
jgi:hypothetical protein